MEKNDILTTYQRLCETKTADLLQRRLCEIIKRCGWSVDVYVRSYFLESFSPYWDPVPDFGEENANRLVADVLKVFAKRIKTQKDSKKPPYDHLLSDFGYYENDAAYDWDYIQQIYSKLDFVHYAYYRKRNADQSDDNPELMRVDAFRIMKESYSYNAMEKNVTIWPLYLMFNEALKEDELIYHKLFACS